MESAVPCWARLPQPSTTACGTETTGRDFLPLLESGSPRPRVGHILPLVTRGHPSVHIRLPFLHVQICPFKGILVQETHHPVWASGGRGHICEYDTFRAGETRGLPLYICHLRSCSDVHLDVRPTDHTGAGTKTEVRLTGCTFSSFRTLWSSREENPSMSGKGKRRTKPDLHGRSAMQGVP